MDEGLSILQYANDTILFLEDDLEQAKNLKLVLCAFEGLYGLKINFHKSEIFAWEKLKIRHQSTSICLVAQKEHFHSNILGVPMSHTKITNKD